MERVEAQGDFYAQERFLGIYLDSKLGTWQGHVNFLANKLLKNIFVIHSLYSKYS